MSRLLCYRGIKSWALFRYADKVDWTVYNRKRVPCLLLLFGIAFPRLALVLLLLFTTFLQRAYHSLLLVALGFVFLPLTTIVYAWIVNGRHPLDGVYLAALLIAVLADLGLIGHGEYQRRRA